MTIRLAGAPVVLCDDLGASLLVGGFREVLPGSVKVFPVGDVNILEAVVLVNIPKMIPSVAVADLGGVNLPIRVPLQSAGSCSTAVASGE